MKNVRLFSYIFLLVLLLLNTGCGKEAHQTPEEEDAEIRLFISDTNAIFQDVYKPLSVIVQISDKVFKGEGSNLDNNKIADFCDEAITIVNNAIDDHSNKKITSKKIVETNKKIIAEYKSIKENIEKLKGLCQSSSRLLPSKVKPYVESIVKCTSNIASSLRELTQYQESLSTTTKQPSSSETSSEKSLDKATNSTKANNKQDTDVTSFIVAKNQYDQDISALAKDINNHLNSNPNFANAPQLIHRAEEIAAKITATKQEVNNANITNTALKNKLLEVLDAEWGRVDGLLEGMNTSKNGGSHIHGFKRGTDSAYRFDDVNAELNKLL